MSRVARLPAEELTRAAAIEATASEAWSLAGLTEELSSDCGRVYGLWEQDKLWGVAVFQLVLDESSLLTFTVDPARRGEGLGEALLRGALAALHSEGARSCFLEVRSQNAPAVGLYRKLGFAEAGRRKGFYRDPADDALLLRLDRSENTVFAE